MTLPLQPNVVEPYVTVSKVPFGLDVLSSAQILGPFLKRDLPPSSWQRGLAPSFSLSLLSCGILHSRSREKDKVLYIYIIFLTLIRGYVNWFFLERKKHQLATPSTPSMRSNQGSTLKPKDQTHNSPVHGTMLQQLSHPARVKGIFIIWLSPP